MSNDNFFRRLNAEISQWETDGLIATEQAAAIRERDEVPGSARSGAIGNRGVSVLAIMGAALIGWVLSLLSRRTGLEFRRWPGWP